MHQRDRKGCRPVIFGEKRSLNKRRSGSGFRGKIPAQEMITTTPTETLLERQGQYEGTSKITHTRVMSAY